MSIINSKFLPLLKSKLKSFGYIILVLAVLNIPVFIVLYAVTHMYLVDGEGFGFTKDITTVNINLNDTTPKWWAEHDPGRPYPTPINLRIPKAFMYFSGNWKGGDQSFVSMEIRPDMTPLALDEARDKDFNNSLSVTLRPLRGRMLYDKYVLDFKKKFTRLPSTAAGYDEYRSPSTMMDYPDKYDLIYIPTDVTRDDAIFVRCNAYPTTPNCTLYDEIDAAIWTETILPKNKPEEWMKIRINVHKLVSQFYIQP